MDTFETTYKILIHFNIAAKHYIQSDRKDVIKQCLDRVQSRNKELYEDYNDEVENIRNQFCLTDKITGEILFSVIKNKEGKDLHIQKRTPEHMRLIAEKIKELKNKSIKVKTCHIFAPVKQLDDFFIDAFRGFILSEEKANELADINMKIESQEKPKE